MFIKVLLGIALIAIATCSSAWPQERKHTAKEECDGDTVDNSFTPAAAANARAFLAELKVETNANNKDNVASMVEYPLRVYSGKETHLVRNRAEFLTMYEKLFTMHIKNVIETESLPCLFGNWQGAMVGQGEIWFREQSDGHFKIVTINLGSGATHESRKPHA